MGFNKRTMLILSLATLFGMSAIGWGAIWLFDGVDVITQWQGKVSMVRQLLFGSLYGLGASFGAVFIVRLPFFRDSLRFFSQIITRLKPGFTEIVFYSLCAAIGEEILFRAAMQQWLGIWPTSVLFIFLHGYLNPMRWRMMLYGVFMVIMSAGIGYMLVKFGLVASMAAHFIYDVFMFSFLKLNAEGRMP